MEEPKAPYIIMIIFLIGMLALYLNLDNQPRAEPVVNLRESLSIESEHESLKESYKAAELETVEKETVKAVAITEEEFESVCRVVMNEAGGESYRCQVAVAETIFNRICQEEFPDTLKEVLNQDSQFSHFENGEITDSVREAVAQVLEYHIFSTDMVYFRSDYYHAFEEAEDYMVIDNMYFSTKK